MSVQITLREAKARLSELLDRAARGEDVEIVRRGAKPGRFRVLPVQPDAALRRPGAMRGAFTVPHDFDAEDPDIVALFGGDGASSAEPRERG